MNLRVTFRAVVAFALAVSLASCSDIADGTSAAGYAAARQHCTAEEKTPADVLGVAAPGVPSSMSGVSGFARAVGKEPGLVTVYTAFGESFNVKFACNVAKLGALPFFEIDPTNVSVAQIASGRYDGYLSSYADAVKAFGLPVGISFAHEMNGSWYAWGVRHVRPAVLVAAWRQIHDVFRAVGASNVTWIWTINVVHRDVEPTIKLYPGNSYVDWVGLDGYYRLPSESFNAVFGKSLQLIRRFTTKRVLIAETGVDMRSSSADKEASSLFTGVHSRKNLLGFVWFNYPDANGEDMQVQSNPGLSAVFRHAIRAGL